MLKSDATPPSRVSLFESLPTPEETRRAVDALAAAAAKSVPPPKPEVLKCCRRCLNYMPTKDCQGECRGGYPAVIVDKAGKHKTVWATVEDLDYCEQWRDRPANYER